MGKLLQVLVSCAVCTGGAYLLMAAISTHPADMRKKLEITNKPLPREAEKQKKIIEEIKARAIKNWEKVKEKK